MDVATARSAMPITQNRIYLDHAAVGPLSGPCRDAMVDATRDICEEGSTHLPRWWEAGDRGRSAFRPALRLDGALGPTGGSCRSPAAARGHRGTGIRAEVRGCALARQESQ